MVDRAVNAVSRLADAVRGSTMGQFLARAQLPHAVPSLEAVNRSAPYIFFCVYLPKLGLDIYDIRKDVPVDVKLAQERQADLDEALARARVVLQCFYDLNMPVPPGGALDVLNGHARLCIGKFFEQYNGTPERAGPALPTFALDDDVMQLLATGDVASDLNDEVHDKLEMLVSNLNVDVRKVVMPSAGTPQVAEAADALSLMVMVRSFFDLQLFDLICYKTLVHSPGGAAIAAAELQTGHSAGVAAAAIAASASAPAPASASAISLSSSSGGGSGGGGGGGGGGDTNKHAKKWAGGKPLVTMWSYERRDFWWSTVPPSAMPRQRRLYEHRKAWDAAVLERGIIKACGGSRGPEQRAGSVAVLMSLQVRAGVGGGGGGRRSLRGGCLRVEGGVPACGEREWLPCGGRDG